MKEKGVRLFIAVPCSHPMMYTKWVFQFLNQLQQYHTFWGLYGTEGDQLKAGIHNHPNLPTNRNELVHYAMDEAGFNATHILFLDSDIIMPSDMVIRMMERNLSVHGLLCFTKEPKYPKPIIYRNNQVIDPFHEGMIEVDSTGTGCLMVKKEAFLDIARLPEFNTNGGKFFDYRETWQGHNCQKLGEDRFFCAMARRAGHKIIVDTANSCHHIGPVPIGIEHYMNAKNKRYVPITVDTPRNT